MPKPNWVITKVKFWKHMPPPSRPWPSEVKWFEKYIALKKKQGQKDVLILGSTVEFRSLCHKYGMNTHVVDFSKLYYKILSRQPMKYRGKETMYEQNWITMDLGKKFDLILGDWVPGVLHSKFYHDFFNHIISHLKDTGLFVFRDGLRPTGGKVDLEKAARIHYKLYAEKYSFYQTSAHFMYAFNPDPKTNMGDLDSAKKELDRIYKKGLVRDDDYKFFVHAFSMEGGNASVMVKRDFEKLLKKYFVIHKTHFGKEPSAPWYPIYVTKKG